MNNAPLDFPKNLFWEGHREKLISSAAVMCKKSSSGESNGFEACLNGYIASVFVSVVFASRG